ncbi:MAG: cell division protein ZapA [Cytophagales bacterium]|jgi:cell division protein ZapA|nr:cell division protein ZapA [Cytophagales bacterium]
MGDLSIKIRIADREYPIRTAVSGEERLRKAGKEINDMMRTLKAQFGGLDDKQDLLAMIAIHYVTEKLRLEEEREVVHGAVSDKVDRLQSLVSSALLF